MIFYRFFQGHSKILRDFMGLVKPDKDIQNFRDFQGFWRFGKISEDAARFLRI